MEIKYSSVVVNGNKLSMIQTQTEPEVVINQHDNNYYSLIMIDINAPVGKSNLNSSFLHWWVANIDLDKNFNEVWFSYFPPTPPKGTGIHHYYFYLLRQPGIIVKPTGMDSILSRAPFDIDYYINTLRMSIIDKRYFTVDS